jgi:predicted methyltransferase
MSDLGHMRTIPGRTVSWYAAAMRSSTSLVIATCLLSLSACEKAESVSPDAAGPSSDPSPASETATAPSLAEVLAAPHRSAEHKARDVHRHPKETLEFFGVKQDMTVLELWPGGEGWYTEILAPWLRAQGRLIATNYSTEGDPKAYQVQSGAKFKEKLAAAPDLYSEVEVMTLPVEILPETKLQFAEPGTVDVALTFRNSHGWFGRGTEKAVYGAVFEALRPGGTFGVVQHRAAAGSDPKKTAEGGYIAEEAVIAAVTGVGFELVEKSEINANPKDTKDHPEGVWALPPSLANGDKDKDKYLAIGESDRMTLRFRKPE